MLARSSAVSAASTGENDMLEIILLTTLTGTAAFLIDSAIEHVTERKR
jgi:hypothetical protein